MNQKDANSLMERSNQTPALTHVQLGDLLADAIALLRVAKCPNCDGSGAIQKQTSSRQLVTREMAMDAGNPEMEGLLYSDDKLELEQCQWCDELHGLLERYTANCQGEPRSPERKP